MGDLCWAYDNATLSFNGHSGELISTGTNSFRIKGDDGTKVDRIYGSDTNVRANGARDDEYWRVTTTDGTRYYFGYNRLPGWASGNAETNSAWTAPVFGNDSGEPCNAAAFADSWCQQGWRWNLDYAVDARGNSIAYYYDKETNHYGRNLKPEDETPYVRGGALNHIDYGLRNTTNYSAKALGRVDFTSAERCLPETGVTCAAATIDDKSFYWYDTPWDLNCKSGTDCTSSPSPSFWTRKRLTGVTASTLKADGTYAPVDTWKMDHRWGMSDIAYQLLLTSVEHTGRAVTPEITLPKVTFGYDQRSNRLDIAERRHGSLHQGTPVDDRRRVRRTDGRHLLHGRLRRVEPADPRDELHALLPGVLHEGGRREPDPAVVQQVRRRRGHPDRPHQVLPGHGHPLQLSRRGGLALRRR